jgi:hypothetical protein
VAVTGLDDLDRLFYRLVQVLAVRRPEALREPIQVAELYQDLVPYRQHRGAMKLDTNQAYEMAMLRLLAGERGYARVEPEEAQQALAAEAQTAYPNPGVVRDYAAARVYLNAAAAQRVLAGNESYAPQMHSGPSVPPARSALSALSARGEEAGEPAEPAEPAAGGGIGAECPYCQGELPVGREAFYCPFCGGNLKGVKCPDCRTELEVGWSFCITCGRKMGGA